MSEHTFYLGMGANIGQREMYLQRALQRLNDHPQIELNTCSSIYETAPVGFTEQGLFLNLVARGQTSLTPFQLLDVTEQLEQSLGRIRHVRWGPRTIDIDILLYDDLCLNTDRLMLPHPRMKDRAFVLIPLAEIEPQLILAGDQVSVQTHADYLLSDHLLKEGIHKWEKSLVLRDGEFVLFEN